MLRFCFISSCRSVYDILNVTIYMTWNHVIQCRQSFRFFYLTFHRYDSLYHMIIYSYRYDVFILIRMEIEKRGTIQYMKRKKVILLSENSKKAWKLLDEYQLNCKLLNIIRRIESWLQSSIMKTNPDAISLIQFMICWKITDIRDNTKYLSRSVLLW